MVHLVLSCKWNDPVSHYHCDTLAQALISHLRARQATSIDAVLVAIIGLVNVPMRDNTTIWPAKVPSERKSALWIGARIALAPSYCGRTARGGVIKKRTPSCSASWRNREGS